MKCSNCGFRFNAGKTCPSCGHNDSEIGSPERTHASQIKCGKCGFRYDFGEFCPSCGNSNPVRDPEHLSRQAPQNYECRTKPKTWVIVLSILGTIYGTIMGFGYSTIAPQIFGFLYIHSIRRLIFSKLGIIPLIFFLLSIFLFINLLRMKKWAVWVLSILNTLNIVLLAIILVAIRNYFLFLMFPVTLFGTAVFWIADWSEYY